MAIRSGTAAKITPNHYDRQRKELTFTTKYSERQTLQVTSELAVILGAQGLIGDVPYVAQLQRGTRRGRPAKLGPLGRMRPKSLNNMFAELRRRCGITRKLTPHDLRRTTATRVYEATKDLRLVQALLGHADLSSTLWYLDHHVTPVPVSALELAKLNPTTEAVH